MYFCLWLSELFFRKLHWSCIVVTVYLLFIYFYEISVALIETIRKNVYFFFLEHLESGNMSSLIVWYNLLVDLIWDWIFSLGRLHITVSISQFEIGLFSYSIFSWISLGRLYGFKNSSISSIFCNLVIQGTQASFMILWSSVVSFVTSAILFIKRFLEPLWLFLYEFS